MNNKLILIFFISIPPLIIPPEIKEEHKLAFKCVPIDLNIYTILMQIMKKAFL